MSLIQATHPWLEERTILLAPTGSYAYGTATEESDRDFKGVCIPPVDYFLGLKSFNEYNTSGGRNFKNTKDDIDINVIHINKFVKDAMEGVPNNIEILFVQRDQFLKLTSVGETLLDNRYVFLSKAIEKKFGGYAISQMKKLKAKNSNGAARSDLIELYGYDTKFFMHCIRLLTSGIEILETGDFQTYRKNRDLLLDCRNGKYSFDQALEMVEYYDESLKTALQLSRLPESPDYEKINNMLIEINKQGLLL